MAKANAAAATLTVLTNKDGAPAGADAPLLEIAI